MKMPSHGEIKMVATDLPQPVKQDLFEDGGRRYMWANLPEPVRQMGHDFSFIVFPLNLTPEGVFEHKGSVVLCQTEAEAKESMELLSEAARETLVILQTPGFGSVGKLTNVRHFFTEISVRFRQNVDGRTEWWAFERDINKATGEVTILRRQQVADELEAKRIAGQWRSEIETKKSKISEAAAKSNTPPPLARCQPLTASEIRDDVAAAKWTALKRRWPRSFAIFERRGAMPIKKILEKELLDAYLLDLVEQGYDPKDEFIRGDLKFIEALAKAAKNFARRKKKKVTDLAIYLIAFNYELGWCYLSDAQLAQKLGEMLNGSFTPDQVEQYRYRTLGLVAKHLPGPSPKASQ